MNNSNNENRLKALAKIWWIWTRAYPLFLLIVFGLITYVKWDIKYFISTEIGRLAAVGWSLVGVVIFGIVSIIICGIAGKEDKE